MFPYDHLHETSASQGVERAGARPRVDLLVLQAASVPDAAVCVCQWLCSAIDRAREIHDLALLAFMFMPEHVHLIVHPRQAAYDISAVLRSIKLSVSRRAIRHLEEHDPAWVEKLTRRRGSRTERLFWQSGGGYDRNVVELHTLRGMIDYLHANPVRRGLVAKPTDWEWSSARHYAGVDGCPLRIDPLPV